MKPSVKAGYLKGEKVSWFGIFSTLALTVFKGIAGVLGRSQAMIADALESASDVLASIIALVSLRISRKPVDDSHPYGHGKAEIIAAGIIGFIIAGAGVAIVLSAGRLIFLGRFPVPGLIALIAVIVTIVVKEGMYQYVSVVGRRLGSPAIIASAWDHRKDALTSVATLIGIAGARLGLPILDPIAAIVVSLFIFKVGYQVIKGAFSGLMDAALSEETMMKIWRIAERIEGVEHINDVRGRNMGQYLLVDIKLQIDSKATVEQGHAIATTVKNEIMKQIERVADVMVHVNPHARHK